MRQRRVWLVGAAVTSLTAVSLALYLHNREGIAPDQPLDPVASARAAPLKRAVPPHGIDYEGNRVVRRDAAGNVLWTTPLEGRVGGVRPPHVQADATRAYVSRADGVTALDVRTGTVLWHSPGPADRLLLSGSLLFATECGAGEEVTKTGRWMTGRDTATGKEAFRVRLPAEGFDPLPIEDAGDLILVQTSEEPDGKGMALLVDRTGQVRHRFDRQVVTVSPLAGGDRLVLTSRDVVRLSDASVKWSAPFHQREWIAGGGFVSLPNGEWVAFLYGRTSDSGVQVVRLDPDSGQQRWATDCGPLRVVHSGYNHTAVAELIGDRLRITSEGSSGTFVEVLEAGDGRSVSRERLKR